MKKVAVAGSVLLALAALLSLQAPGDIGHDCGAYELVRPVGQPSHLTQQRCLVHAFRTGAAAELRVQQPTVEGDPIALHYRVVATGVVDVVVDSRLDRFGSGRIQTYRCRSLSTGEGVPSHSSCTEL